MCYIHPVYSSHFDLDLNLASDAIHLKNQVDLLQIQQIIEVGIRMIMGEN